MSKEEKSVKVEVKPAAKPVVKHEVPPTNELVFLKDEAVVLKNLPFKLKEVKGAELVLIRTDIK